MRCNKGTTSDRSDGRTERALGDTHQTMGGAFLFLIEVDSRYRTIKGYFCSMSLVVWIPNLYFCLLLFFQINSIISILVNSDIKWAMRTKISNIPTPEKIVYFAIWVSSVLYSVYRFAVSTHNCKTLHIASTW